MDLSIRIISKNLKCFNKKSEKWSKKTQIYFLKTIASLLSQGFSMGTSLNFLAYLMNSNQQDLLKMENHLNQGKDFIEILSLFGFSQDSLSQMTFAREQGRLLEGIKETANYLEKIQEYQRKIKKALAYPILLLVFLVGLLFGMKFYLLPNLLNFLPEDAFDSHLGVRVLFSVFELLPQLFLLTISCLVVLFAYLDYRASKLSLINRYQMWCGTPIISKWMRLYLTQKFSKELGHFLIAGYSMKHIMDCVKKNEVNSFHTEIYKYFEQELMLGKEMKEIVQDINIFMKEFDLVIFQGQLTSQTGLKCQIYAERLLDEMLEDIEQKVTWIQPILFIFIAIIILMLYLMIMLPMLTMDGLTL